MRIKHRDSEDTELLGWDGSLAMRTSRHTLPGVAGRRRYGVCGAVEQSERMRHNREKSIGLAAEQKTVI